jgi:lysine-specific demethylase 8
VRLYAPCQSHRLYAFPSGLTTNSSRVDVSNVDDAAFPLFRGTPYLEAVLKPGDALFIPIFHWHYVRSLTPSFSVSFWWK